MAADELEIDLDDLQRRMDGALSALRGDKKSVGGRTRFVLPTRIGAVTVGHEVGDAEIERAIAELIE